MLGRICSHTFSLGFGGTFVVTYNDLYIEPGVGLQWAFSTHGATGWEWTMRLGFGSGETKTPVICIALQAISCPLFSTS